MSDVPDTNREDTRREGEKEEEEKITPQIRVASGATPKSTTPKTSRHSSPDVVILAIGIAQQIRRRINTSRTTKTIITVPDQTVLASLVAAGLPEHRPAKAELLKIVDLLPHHGGCVVGDEFLRGAVVAVGAAGRRIEHDCSSGLGESLVIPDAVLPGAGADTRVRCSDTAGLLEGASVDGHAENDLAPRDAGRNVVLDSLVNRKWSGVGVSGIGIEICQVAGEGAPRTGKVVSHEVERIDNVRNTLEIHHVIVVGSSRRGNGQEEVIARGMLSSVGIQLLAHGLEKQDEVLRLGRVGGVFPINVEAVESPVLHDGDGALRE